MPAIASLECSRCHHHISADTPQTLCPLCAGSLYVRYDMDALRRTAKREDIIPRAAASPAKRYGDPAEFGSYFAYLCSAQAGYITAQNLLIDGGSYPGTF